MVAFDLLFSGKLYVVEKEREDTHLPGNRHFTADHHLCPMLAVGQQHINAKELR